MNYTFIPLVLVIFVAIAVGYLMGTEAGRQRWDTILVKLGRGPEDDSSGTGAPVAEESEEVKGEM